MEPNPPLLLVPGLQPPTLRHSELEILFRHDLRIPLSEVESLLALPPESLLQDLEGILSQAEAWRPAFEQAGHHSQGILPPDRTCMLHALNLVAQLRQPGSMPVLMDFARSSRESLDFWLGKFLHESLWELFYQTQRHDHALLADFAREPGLCLPVRAAAIDCMAQIAWQQPIKRPEVFAWFEAIFTDVLGGRLLWHPRSLSLALRNAVDLRARNLLPLIRRLYEEQELDLGLAGEWEKVAQEMDPGGTGWPVRSWIKRQVFDLPGRYAYLVATLYPSSPEEKDTAVKLHRIKAPKPGQGELRVMGRKQQPLRKGAKVGRNDPCPCGSGKKYKKCHGK